MASLVAGFASVNEAAAQGPGQTLEATEARAITAYEAALALVAAQRPQEAQVRAGRARGGRWERPMPRTAARQPTAWPLLALAAGRAAAACRPPPRCSLLPPVPPVPSINGNRPRCARCWRSRW